MSVTHLVGPVVDWTRFGRKLKVRVVADAYADFAMMNAYAFNAYSAVHAIDGMKTTLAYFGYHYALGASASGRVDLDWGNFWVRGLASAHAYGSWDGRDRFESELDERRQRGRHADPLPAQSRVAPALGPARGSSPPSRASGAGAGSGTSAPSATRRGPSPG